MSYRIYFHFSTAVTRVASERIYLNEMLILYRRELLKQANQKRKDSLFVSAWSMEGNIFIKIKLLQRTDRLEHTREVRDLCSGIVISPKLEAGNPSNYSYLFFVPLN